MMNREFVVLAAAGLISVALLAAGCKEQAASTAGKGAPGAMAIQVVAVEATKQPVSETLQVPGNIAANEMVEIKSETDGIVEQINFDEGQRVEKGALLLKLDETKFAASLAQAEANFKLSQANHDRAKQLFQDKLVSQQDFDQASSAFAASVGSVEWMRRQLKDARIHAPFAGISGARQVSPGQVVSRNTIITWLVDLDTVKVEVKVPERFLSQVKTGQPLDFKVAAYPNQTFRGEVYFISPQLDESTRSALIKARIANLKHQLKSGMFAELNLTLRHKEDAIVIPEPALIYNGENVTVYIIDAQTNALPRPIKVGERLVGKVEVLSGVAAGEKVVVEGVQKLRPGAPVRLAPPEAAAPYLK